jgi:redox-sensitive bicupin YhaK (pirin superfamily)
MLEREDHEMAKYRVYMTAQTAVGEVVVEAEDAAEARVLAMDIEPTNVLIASWGPDTVEELVTSRSRPA